MLHLNILSSSAVEEIMPIAIHSIGVISHIVGFHVMIISGTYVVLPDVDLKHGKLPLESGPPINNMAQ